MTNGIERDALGADPAPRQRSPLLWWSLLAGGLALVAAVVAIVMFYIGDGDASDSGVTMNEIVANPSEHYGRLVSLSGEIARLVGEHGLVMEGAGAGAGDGLLVIGAVPLATGRQPGGPDLEGNTVLVSGVVRPFDVTLFENELAVDLNPDAFRGWENRPALVATSLEVLVPAPAGSQAEATLTVTVRGDRLEPARLTLPAGEQARIRVESADVPCLFTIDGELGGLLVPAGGSAAVAFTPGTDADNTSVMAMGCAGSAQHQGEITVTG
jgi:hypothetical protein